MDLSRSQKEIDMRSQIASQSDQVAGLGKGVCEGGFDPHPALKLFPYLAFVPGHPVHGNEVHTEDGKVSVETIGVVAAMVSDDRSLADMYGTTPEHVRQALSYLSHVLMMV